MKYIKTLFLVLVLSLSTVVSATAKSDYGYITVEPGTHQCTSIIRLFMNPGLDEDVTITTTIPYTVGGTFHYDTTNRITPLEVMSFSGLLEDGSVTLQIGRSFKVKERFDSPC